MFSQTDTITIDADFLNVYRGDGEFDTHIYKAGKRMSKAVMI